MKKQTFPAGWSEKKVRRLLDRYERQTEAEAVAEDEAAFDKSPHTIMKVPRALVPVVRTLIAKRQKRSAA